MNQESRVEQTWGALVALRICQHFTSSSPAVKKYISWMALKPVVMIFGRALVASFCSQPHSHQCCRMLPTLIAPTA